MAKIQRALISVSEKDGLIPFAQTLAEAGVEILSTGGTARVMREAGLEVIDVSDYTGFPEMMDGRVKTLHPRVFAGILCRHDRDDDLAALTEHDIRQFNLVVVNLYPFEETVAKGSDFATCIENIDIGGPAMIRSAAKNHASVTVSTDPSDYPAIMEAMAQHNGATYG